MTKEISLLLGELKSRLNAYVGLMGFRFSNLCVKADPVAMLPITVEVNGAMYQIEDTCDVTKPNDFQLMLYPKSNDLTNQISKGVIETHPEMKQERLAILDNEKQEEVPLQNLQPDDKVLGYSIRLTMPIVNKERYKVLTDAVKVLYDDTLANIDGNCEAYTARIPVELEGHPQMAKETDEAEEKLKSLRDEFLNLAKSLRDDKIQEIEEAYQKYLNGEQEILDEEERKAAEEENIMSMKMPEAPEMPEMPEAPQ